jgi:hypothetical protein
MELAAAREGSYKRADDPEKFTGEVWLRRRPPAKDGIERVEVHFLGRRADPLAHAPRWTAPCRPDRPRPGDAADRGGPNPCARGHRLRPSGGVALSRRRARQPDGARGGPTDFEPVQDQHMRPQTPYRGALGPEGHERSSADQIAALVVSCQLQGGVPLEPDQQSNDQAEDEQDAQIQGNEPVKQVFRSWVMDLFTHHLVLKPPVVVLNPVESTKLSIEERAASHHHKDCQYR